MNDTTTYGTHENTVSPELRRWYALKIFFNRAVEIKEEIEQYGLETYLPMALRKIILPNGKERMKEMPLIGSLMFVKSDQEQIETLAREMKGRISVYTLPGTRSIPAVVPEDEMLLFKLVTSPCAGETDFLGEDSARWHVGDLVRVTAGPLEGAVGHICRIKGNRRLVVSVRGVCAVATSYIPSRFLEPVNNRCQ